MSKTSPTNEPPLLHKHSVSGSVFCKSTELVDFEGETWKDIYGYEGMYKVSSFGRVKSMLKNHKILKQWSGGYSPMVTLCADGIKTKLFVSNIVGGVYIGFPDRDNNEVYCHLNKDKWDNRVVNLSIETKSVSFLLNYHLGVSKDWGIKEVGAKTRFVSKQKYKGVDKNGNEVLLSHNELLEKYGTGVRSIFRCLSKEKNFNTSYGRVWSTVAI